MSVERLVQIGLSEKEAVAYLMLLRVGPSLASSLARRVKLKRVTVYSVLESLMEKGLIGYQQSRTGKQFMALEPERLLYKLENEQAQLKLKMNMAKECVENLSGIHLINSAASS